MEPVEFFSESEIKTSTSYATCAVPNCSSKGSDAGLIFHRFPAPNKRSVEVTDYFGNKKIVDQFEAWKSALKLENVQNSNVVCSLHFSKEAYYLPDYAAQRRRLRTTAVPTCNLPGKKISTQKLKMYKSRRERFLNRNKRKNDSEQIQKEAPKSPVAVKLRHNSENENINERNIDVSGNSEHIMNSECIQYFHFKNSVEDMPLCESISTVDLCSDNKCKFLDHINSDKKLSTATGIESFKILDSITQCYIKVVGNQFENNKTIMKTSDRILLTFVKLKQNLTYSFLAIVFNSVSEQRCQRIFTETLQILSKVLKVAIPWPSKEEMKRNIPLCFEEFQDTRIILDCTEIFIQRPKNLCCQILTYSHYKGGQTCKFMTGVTPAGDISFVSKAYGGRVSDSRIFEQSELISLLEPGDSIMVDRGFLIEEICEKKQWKCIKPPYLKDKKQFTEVESVMTAKIAKARVHIERSNQRIKNFEIMSTVMPVNLVPLVEDIMIVICATVNLS